MAKKESTTDWELMIMGFMIVGLLWTNTITRPDEVEITEVGPETKNEVVVEVVEEVEIEETVKNYSSGNQQGINKELQIECPTCKVHLRVEKIENKQ